jgi:hypothetical protein
MGLLCKHFLILGLGINFSHLNPMINNLIFCTLYYSNFIKVFMDQAYIRTIQSYIFEKKNIQIIILLKIFLTLVDILH